MYCEVFPCSSVQQAGTARRNDGLKTRAEETLPLPLSLSLSRSSHFGPSHKRSLLRKVSTDPNTHDEFSVNCLPVHHDSFSSDLNNAGNVNGLGTGNVVCVLLK